MATMRLPVHRPRRRSSKKRADVATFIALMGLTCMIYLMEAEVPLDHAEAPTDRRSNEDKFAQQPPRMRGLARAVVDRNKEMNEFAAWVQEATNDMEDEVHRQRLLAILKTKWPECIAQDLTSLQCKALIDNEIQHTDLFTGPVDKAITTVVLHTRSEMDANYNYVVIRTNEESGRTAGVWQDGWVYYDFTWNSTGIEADVEAQTDIPPWNGNPPPNAATIDEFRGVASEGRRLAQIDRDKIIAGGYYHLNHTDSPTAAANLDTFLSTPKTVGAAGPRNLGPWNCQGLTGVSCCSKIKHSVRDKDVNGKAIQCWIEPFTSGLMTKQLCEEDLTKVCIYETHDGKVWKDPILSYDRILDEAIAAGRDITKSEGVHV